MQYATPQELADQATASFLVSVLLIALGIVVLRAIIASGVRSGVRKALSRRLEGEVIHVNAQQNAPGRFRIDGVDRETKMDTTWHTQANSPENARAKGELEGICVTRVERV